ncbi:MAG TPA: TraR/DksA family transcriptional regulator [Candidatus Methylomirabilis sp.]|jgi:DnaK suppressor protein|nr:TraR/DksA family transcriptional regulator [Candidatus Methylomirabilis sp.]
MKPKDRLDRRTMKEIERFLKDKHAKLKESLRRVLTGRYPDKAHRSAAAAAKAIETLRDEIQVAVVDNRSRQLAQIEAALERLSRRDYGICDDCAEFIGLARLRALPFAERCTPCQSHAELQESRRARRLSVAMG